MKTVAQTLIEARQAAGLSQKQVAETLGISSTFLSDIENGKRAFGEQHLPKLPVEMQRAVAEAMLDEHREAMDRIRRSIS